MIIEDQINTEPHAFHLQDPFVILSPIHGLYILLKYFVQQGMFI